MTTGIIMLTLICVIGMEFLPLSRRHSSSRNVPSSEERGETDVFTGYRYMKIAHDLVTDQSGTGMPIFGQYTTDT